MKSSLIALLGAATLAIAQRHAHNHAAHHHPARNISPLEARDAVIVTQTAPGPVETIYELNGVGLAYKDVEEGLKNGKYVLVGGEVASSAPATSADPVTSLVAAVFKEKAPSTSAPEPTSTPEPEPSPEPTTSSTPEPVPASSSKAAAVQTPSSSSGNVDINAEFPSGTIPCTEFPSAYGAKAASYLGLDDWTGVQRVPSFKMGVSKSISEIHTAISGEGCTAKSFCSYQCPAGYQKSQWPSTQGNTGQSIGGLYCNADGMLELSNTSEKRLCIKGTGGVKVRNEISSNACICRTDYPGTESETVALETQPGQEYELTCPDALTYYTWEGGHTSAQYYINPSGNGPEKACLWSTAGSNLGNYSPLNAGVGRGTDGVIYLSLFPNHPSNMDGVLDYNVKIEGGSISCKYEGGKYYSQGSEVATGCTVSSFPSLVNG